MGYLLVIFWRKWDILSDVWWLLVVAVHLVSSHSYQIFRNSLVPLVMWWEADSRIMWSIPGRFVHLCWCHPFFPWFRTLPPTLINSLWSNGAIWRHKSGSILTQAMACCLTAPSHYLNQCWLIISKVQWHSSESNFTRDTSAISHWN